MNEDNFVKNTVRRIVRVKLRDIRLEWGDVVPDTMKVLLNIWTHEELSSFGVTEDYVNNVAVELSEDE